MNIKNLFTRKNIIWAVVVLVVLAGGYFLFFNKKTKEQMISVHAADFLQQVSASGKVVAKDDLNLSFQESGLVTGVYVKTGDTVHLGQLLASQNTGELSAQLAQMQAGVDLAQAKLDQLLAGASEEDIKTSNDAVSYANQNLNNSYASAYNILNGGYTSISSAYTNVAYIQTTYFFAADKQSFTVLDSKKIINDNIKNAKTYLDSVKNNVNNSDIDFALSLMITNLNSTYDNLAIVRAQCNQDIYDSRISLADKASLDTQKTNINTVINTTTSLQSSIASYKTALIQAESALNLKKSQARPADIAIYKAQIDQAKASYQNTLAQLNKKRIYSPIAGVVTLVNAKVGSVLSAGDGAVSVISNNSFQIESYIPEINIALVKVGQAATITLDAYGSDTFFDANVISINPAETITDGVSTYKVTLEFTKSSDERIKSGMTGNIIITTLQKSGVISVPQGVVIVRGDQKFVVVKNNDVISEVKIETGSLASNGNIEVVSGLKDGDNVIQKSAN